jgi:hypothetical protein
MRASRALGTDLRLDGERLVLDLGDAVAWSADP